MTENEEFSLIKWKPAECLGNGCSVIAVCSDNVDGIVWNGRSVRPADPLPVEVPRNPEQPGAVGRIAPESLDADESSDERVLREIGGVSRLTTHAPEERIDGVFVALEFRCKLELLAIHITHLVAPNVLDVTRFLSVLDICEGGARRSAWLSQGCDAVMPDVGVLA